MRDIEIKNNKIKIFPDIDGKYGLTVSTNYENKIYEDSISINVLNTGDGSGGQSTGENVKLLQIAHLVQNANTNSWYNNMNCGPACYVMVDSYFKNVLPQPSMINEADDWLYTNLNIPFDPEYKYNGPLYPRGLNSTELINLIKEKGGFDESSILLNQTLDDIKSYINSGYPVIVPVTYPSPGSGIFIKHFLLVIGYSDDEVLVNDPGSNYGSAILNGARSHFKNEDFIKYWGDNSPSYSIIKCIPKEEYFLSSIEIRYNETSYVLEPYFNSKIYYYNLDIYGWKNKFEMISTCDKEVSIKISGGGLASETSLGNGIWLRQIPLNIGDNQFCIKIYKNDIEKSKYYVTVKLHTP
jgi:hypothetical protein